MRKMIDLTGRQFGRLLVVGFSHKDKGGRSYWHVRCVCGGEKIVEGNNLKTDHTKSCGCIKEICIPTHAKSNTPSYLSWAAMKSRCYNKKTKAYKYYGGRGIKVCDRWLSSFENFLEDMGERPKNMILERINNNKGYYKNNCKWATWEEQANNRRGNKIINYNGLSLTLPQWARKLHIHKSTLNNRINVSNWSIQKAFTTA